MKTYKNAMDKIKASDDFKAQTAEKLVENQEKKNKFRFAPIAAIAASLAVVIALGAVFFPMSKENKSFVITANAAELNDNSFTTIGELPASGWWTEWDDNNSIISAGAEADFMLSVKGENIKEITYSIENGAFAVPNINRKILKSDKVAKAGYMPNRAGKSYYSTVTTSYNNQFDVSNDNVEVMLNASVDDGFIRLAESFTNIEGVLWVDEVDKSEVEKYRDITEAYFNAALKKCGFVVRIKYDDGTEQEQKVQLSTEVKVETHPQTIMEQNGKEKTGVTYVAVVKLNAKLL